MSTPKIDPARLSLAVHEAGHVVVGVVHGARLQRVTLSADASRGCTQFSAASFQTAGPMGFRSHIAAAGAVAEAMVAHGPRPALHQVDALLRGSDRRELDLIGLASLHREPLPVSPVTELLSRCWRAMVYVAADLYSGQTVTHTDVCRELGVRDEGGAHSVGLAMLRSGL